MKAWNLWNECEGQKFIDENFSKNCLVSETLRWMNVTLLCTQEYPNDRPSMSSVVFMLEDECTGIAEPLEPEPTMSLSNIGISIKSSEPTNGSNSYIYSKF